MDIPAGLDSEADECVLLKRTIYGLYQAARKYFQVWVTAMTSIGFVESAADPCLFIRRDTLGVVYCGLHVDDSYMTGDAVAVDSAVRDIQTKFKILVQEQLDDDLSCEIQFNDKKTAAWIGQPHLVKNLRKRFGPEVEKRTPGTPSWHIIRPKEGEPVLLRELQTRYRGGVGMLLYLDCTLGVLP